MNIDKEFKAQILSLIKESNYWKAQKRESNFNNGLKHNLSDDQLNSLYKMHRETEISCREFDNNFLFSVESYLNELEEIKDKYQKLLDEKGN